jgi:hypothetical protein
MPRARPASIKDKVAAAVRRVFDVTSYVYMAEAWVLASQIMPADELRSIEQHGIRNHPDCTEAIVFIAEDANGMAHAQQVITRSRGKKPRLGKLKWIDMPEMPGRLAGMLPAEGTRQ